MKISVIGGGNLGSAIVEGIVNSKSVDPKNVTVSDPSDSVKQYFMRFNTAINVVSSNETAIKGADIVIVAVKPKFIEEVLRGISSVIDRDRQIVVSVAAGVTIEALSEYLSITDATKLNLFRVITNTAISVGEAVTLLSAAEWVTDQHKECVRRLFAGSGRVWEVEEERMTPMTALSSCGTAYALKYIEAAACGGVKIGAGADESLDIVLQTIRGALKLVEEHRSRPLDEIERVATKGGITRKGLDAMEESGFSKAVLNGLLASS